MIMDNHNEETKGITQVLVCVVTDTALAPFSKRMGAQGFPQKEGCMGIGKLSMGQGFSGQEKCKGLGKPSMCFSLTNQIH